MEGEMNREDIIRMAREAGFNVEQGFLLRVTGIDEDLERFAALVAEHLRYDGIHSCHPECTRPACVVVREAVAAEREACAQVCERPLLIEGEEFDCNKPMQEIIRQGADAGIRAAVAAIRARGEK